MLTDKDRQTNKRRGKYNLLGGWGIAAAAAVIIASDYSQSQLCSEGVVSSRRYSSRPLQFTGQKDFVLYNLCSKADAAVMLQ